jgi:hypothetical protein
VVFCDHGVFVCVWVRVLVDCEEDVSDCVGEGWGWGGNWDGDANTVGCRLHEEACRKSG